MYYQFCIIIILLQLSLSMNLFTITTKQIPSSSTCRGRIQVWCKFHQQKKYIHSNRFYDDGILTKMKNNIEQYFTPVRSILHIYKYR